MAKPARLTRRQAWLLVCMVGGWMPVMYDRDDRRVTDGLLRLSLAKADADYPAPKKAWTIRPTRLGVAIGCLLIRRTGGRLTRKGIANLAKYRPRIVEHFDVDGSVASLVAERRHLLELNRERERVIGRKAAARG